MDRRNSEGYYDPTAHAALVSVASAEKANRYLPLVYIASPFAGDTETNIKQARKYCAFAVTNGCIPLAPHLHYPQFMDDGDTAQRELGLGFALVLLAKCDELWAFGTPSEGMSREIAKAKKRGMPVRYFSTDCKEVFVCTN